MESEYLQKLSAEHPDVGERYRLKLKLINGLDPFVIDSLDLDYTIHGVPPISNMDIISYLVFSNSFYSKEQLKAFKSLQAYKYFESGFVVQAGTKIINDFYVLIGKVISSRVTENDTREDKHYLGLLPRTFNKQKTEPSEKKNSKKPIEGPRQRPSDADTIQRMLANLPAKRSRRSLISLRDVVFKSRKNKQGNKSQTTKIKCGKSVCKKQQTDSTKTNTLQQRNRRSMRSLNKVLSSRILDLNSSLIVKRKLQVFRDRRSTKNPMQTNVTDVTPEEHTSFINSDIQTSEKRKIPKKNVNTNESTKIEGEHLGAEKKKTLGKQMLTGRLNIKNFFPIRKKSARSKQQKPILDQLPNTYNEIDEHKHNTETRSLYLENSQNMKKNKRGGLKGFVRALSLRKRNSKCDEPTDNTKNIIKTDKAQLNPASPKKVGRPRTKQVASDKSEKYASKMESSSDNVDINEEASKKRKMQRSYRSVISKVKKIKTDKTPPKPTENILENNSLEDANTNSFLEEKNLKQIIIPPEENVIFAKVEEKTLERKDHAHIVHDKSSSVENTCLSGITKSMPEKPGSHTNKVLGTITNNKDLMTQKNDYCHLDPHHSIVPVTIDTSLKPKCIPLVSPNIKGKIRKPNRGLNDCIAMLTNKLQQKDEKISSSLESLFSTSSTMSAERTENHQILESNPQPFKNQKNEFILKIPSFKATKSKIIEEESALDLSKKSFSSPNLLYPHSNKVGYIESTINKVIEGVIEHKCKEVLNEKFTTSAWSSVDDIIQQVVQNTSSVSFNSFTNKKTSLPVRTHVDDTIDFVVNSSNNWFENKINPVEEKRRLNKKIKKRRHSDDNLIKDIILGKDKLIIAPSSKPHNALENSLIAKIKENESKLSATSNTLCEILENNSDSNNLVLDACRTDCYYSITLTDESLPDPQKNNSSCKTIDQELNISRCETSTIEKIGSDNSSKLMVDKALEEKSEFVQNVILDDKKQTDIEVTHKTDVEKGIGIKNETHTEEQIPLTKSMKLKCPDQNGSSAMNNIENSSMQDNLQPSNEKKNIKEIYETVNIKKSLSKLTTENVIETNMDHLVNDTLVTNKKLEESKTNSLIETIEKKNKSLELTTEDEPIILEDKALEKSLKLPNSDSEDEVPLALIAKQEAVENSKQSNVLQILEIDLKSDLEKSEDTKTKTELLEVSSSSSKLEEETVNNEEKNTSNPVNVIKDIVENLTGDSLKENIEQEVNLNENTTSKTSNISESVRTLRRKRKINVFRTKKFANNKRKTKIKNIVESKIQFTPVPSNIKSNSLVVEEGSSIDNNLELPKDNQSDLPKEEAVCNEPLNIYPDPANDENTKIHEPIKILINKQRTRRKSKSSKKVEKFNNDLFRDFSLVINKKTKRIPPTSIVDDSVCDDVLDKSINMLVKSVDVSKVENIKHPADTNESQLNDSVEEMDMEIEDIPIKTNIIERDNEQITVIKSQEEMDNIFDITVNIQNVVDITAASNRPGKKSVLNANNESTFNEMNLVTTEPKQRVFKRTRNNQAEEECLNKTYSCGPLEVSEDTIEMVLNIDASLSLENTKCHQKSLELDCTDAFTNISSVHNDSGENTKGNHNSQYENVLDEKIRRNIQENILSVQQEIGSPTKITEDLVIYNGGGTTSKSKTPKKNRKSKSNLKLIKNVSQNKELCIHQKESEIDNSLAVLVSLKRNKRPLKRNKNIVPDENEKTVDFPVSSFKNQEIGHTILSENIKEMIPENKNECNNKNQSAEMTDQIKCNTIGESHLGNIDLHVSPNGHSVELLQEDAPRIQNPNTESFTECEKEITDQRTTKNTTKSDNQGTTFEKIGLISKNENSVSQLPNERNTENISEKGENPLKFHIISYASDMSSKALDLQNVCSLKKETLKNSKKVSNKKNNIKKGTVEYFKDNSQVADNIPLLKNTQNNETLGYFEEPLDESTPKKNRSPKIKNNIETGKNTNLSVGLTIVSTGDEPKKEVETDEESFKSKPKESIADNQIDDTLTNVLLKTKDHSALLNADQNISTPEILEVMNTSPRDLDINHKSCKTMKNKMENPAFLDECMNSDDNKNGRKMRKSRRIIKECLEPRMNESNFLLVKHRSKNDKNALSSPEVDSTKITSKSEESASHELNSHDVTDALTTRKNSNTSIQTEISGNRVVDNWASDNKSISLENNIEDSGFIEKSLGDSPEKRPEIKLTRKKSHNFESSGPTKETKLENEKNKKNTVGFLPGETQYSLEESHLKTKKPVSALTKKKKKGFKGNKNKLKNVKQLNVCSPKIPDESLIDILPDVLKTDSDTDKNETSETKLARKLKRTNKSNNYEKLSTQNDSENKNIPFTEPEKSNSVGFLDESVAKKFLLDSEQLLGNETEMNAKDRVYLWDYDTSLWGLRRSSRNKNQKSADVLESRSNDVSNEKKMENLDISSLKSNATIPNVESTRMMIVPSISYDSELKIISDPGIPHNTINSETSSDLFSGLAVGQQIGINKRPRKNIDYNEENMEKRVICSTENQEIKDHSKEFKDKRQQRNKNPEKSVTDEKHTFLECQTLEPSNLIPNKSAIVPLISENKLEKQNKSEIINYGKIITQELPHESYENSHNSTVEEKHKSTVKSNDNIISKVSLLTDFSEMPTLIVDLELIDGKYDGLLKSLNYDEKKAKNTNKSLDSFGFQANTREKTEEVSQKYGSTELICQGGTKEKIESKNDSSPLPKKEKQQKRFLNSNSWDKGTKTTKDLDIFDFEEPVTQNANEDISGNMLEAPEHLEPPNSSFTEYSQSKRDRKSRKNINYNEEKLQNSIMDRKNFDEMKKINLKNVSDNSKENEQIKTKKQNSKKPLNELESSEVIKNEKNQLSQSMETKKHHLALRHTRKSRKNVDYNEEILSKTIEIENTVKDNLKNTLNMDNEASVYDTDDTRMTLTYEKQNNTNIYRQPDLQNLQAVEAKLASKIVKKKDTDLVKLGYHVIEQNTTQLKIDSLKNADSKSTDLDVSILPKDQKVENCPENILDPCCLPSESMQKSLDTLMENLEIHKSENVDCVENTQVSDISIVSHQELSKTKKIKKNIMDIDIANILDSDLNSENRRSSRNLKQNVNSRKTFWDIEVEKSPKIFSGNKNELTEQNEANEKMKDTSSHENQDDSSPDRKESLSLLNKVNEIIEDLKCTQSELNIFKTTELIQNSRVIECTSDYINNSKDSLPVISNSMTDEVLKNNDCLDSFGVDKSNNSNLDLSITDAINTEELILKSETVTSSKNKRKAGKQKDNKIIFTSSQSHDSEAINEAGNLGVASIIPKKDTKEELFAEKLGQMCNLANLESFTPSKAQKLYVHSQKNEDYDTIDLKINLEEDDFGATQNSIIKPSIPSKSKYKKLKRKIIFNKTPPSQNVLHALNKSLQTNSELSEKINFTALQNAFKTISKPGKKTKNKEKGVLLSEIEPLTDIITCSEIDIAPVLDEIDKSLESEDIYDLNAELVDEMMINNKKKSSRCSAGESISKIYYNNGQREKSAETSDYLKQLCPVLEKPTRKNSRKSAKVKTLANIHEKGSVALDDFASKINVVREKSGKRSKSLNALKEDKNLSSEGSKQLVEKSDGLSSTTTNDVIEVSRTLFSSSSENLLFPKAEDGCFQIFSKIKENGSQDPEITKLNLEQSEISKRNNEVEDIIDGQELRRSRRGSRKVASYNENDLIDPLIDALETRRNRSTKKERSTEKNMVKKDVPKDATTEKSKPNSEELFEILKNTTKENENINILKPRNSFLENLNAPTSNTDSYDEEVDSILEKPSFTPNRAEKIKDIDKIYEFTEDSSEATKEFSKNKRKNIANQQKLLENSKINFVSNSTIENSVEISSEGLQEKTVVTEKCNFCEICNKTFIRVENLTKHKTTLTHISKLSELEAKEVEERTKVEIDTQNLEVKSVSAKSIDSLRNEINIRDILQPSERTQEDSPSVLNSNQLNLVDIISDVLNKPVLENYNSEKHSHLDKTKNNSYEGDIRRYKSVGERKSFESENQLTRISTTVSQTYLSSMSKTTILENQINLLENIIGNKLENLAVSKSETENHYIEELSSCSNDSNTIAADNSCTSNKSSFNLNSRKKKMISDADFIKPSQYEEISEDSANVRVYEDSKLRKTLNRDEELFLECCSLLKSGSEVSNSNYAKNLKNPLNSNKELDELNSIGNKKLIQTVEEAHEYSDNSRTPTPLGDTYDDEASNSNTISSNWNLKSEKPLDRNRSFSFEEVVNKEEAGISFGEVLTKGLRNQFEYMNHPEKRPQNDQPFVNTITIDRKYDSDSSTKSKKISTKGARKVFEGLKVSIPTEDLNLDVLNTNIMSKKLESKEIITSNENQSTSCSKPRPTRKSKPVKKSQVGSSLLFKINKKKALSQTSKNVPNSKEEIYSLEDTQDNTEIFPKPKNVILDSENESLGYADSIGADAKSVSSVSSISALSSKKPEASPENITKKKYKIMGKIFRNAAKSKIDDIDEELRNIPEIPEIDNLELVENYVRSCQRVTSPFLPPPPPPPLDELPKKPKMTEEEMNLLFDQLLGKETNEMKNENANNKMLLAKVKPDCKTADGKKKNTKTKNRKRPRINSDSSDDEFNINRTAKKRTNKKNNQEDSGINLELELKECIGVASRKSQRKCTSGKQNILVEYWSSDEEAFEALLENQKLLARKIDDRKKSEQNKSETGEIPKEDQRSETYSVSVERPLKTKPAKKKVHLTKKHKSISNIDTQGVDSIPSISNRRKRAAANPLYHWSSSSEDESQSLIEIKPIREEDDDEDRPVQHGWIVGDSPKKLVTMLALTKGKKNDIDSVKEQGKRRTSSIVS